MVKGLFKTFSFVIISLLLLLNAVPIKSIYIFIIRKNYRKQPLHCLFPITTPLVKMGDRKVRRLSCPPKFKIFFR